MNFRDVFEGMFSKKSQEAPASRDETKPLDPPPIVGRIVKSMTALKTSGYVMLDGQRVEVKSRSGFIRDHTYVIIVGIRMGRW